MNFDDIEAFELRTPGRFCVAEPLDGRAHVLQQRAPSGVVRHTVLLLQRSLQPDPRLSAAGRQAGAATPTNTSGCRESLSLTQRFPTATILQYRPSRVNDLVLRRISRIARAATALQRNAPSICLQFDFFLQRCEEVRLREFLCRSLAGP